MLPRLPSTIPRRRVVVTGVGLVTPLGATRDITWHNLVAGNCGIRPLEEEKYQHLPCKIAAQVARGKHEGEFDPTPFITNKRAQDAPYISFALAAASEALQDAQWPPENASHWNPTKTGVAIGSGIGGSVDESLQAGELMNSAARGFRKISPFFIPKVLINLAAGHVSIKHGFRGPNHSCVTACASGAHSIGDASRFIQRGDADVMIAGGTESTISPLSIAGFSRIKALCTEYHDSPSESSRPFDKDRAGFVMGEGAGMVVLEEYEHAVKRGATIYAEVRGYGLSGDASHITAPEETGRGAIQCMKEALRDSCLDTTHVDYINAHATSTPIGDAVEARAISSIFGEDNEVFVSSTKGAVGHLLGAAGAVESIFSILSIKHGVMPPALNLEQPDDEFNLNFVNSANMKRDVNVAMSNSFGFGGTNTSLIFSKLE